MYLEFAGNRYRHNRKYVYRIDDREVTLYEARIKRQGRLIRLLGYKALGSGEQGQIYRSSHLFDMLITAIDSGNARPLDNKPMTQGPVLVGEWTLRSRSTGYVLENERIMQRA